MDGVRTFNDHELNTKVCIDMLKRTNWTVEERIRQNIIQAIQDRGMFEKIRHRRISKKSYCH